MDSKVPARIGRLEELANNLWWSWHEEARDVFRALDYPLWKQSGHNPVKQLLAISTTALQTAASDPSFVALYDSVMATFDADMKYSNDWLVKSYPNLAKDPIAYLSMEYAIHNSLPIYAGGLGILAGDICKEASDLGLPMVAVGFMYPQGYFNQHISPDGWQQETYRQLDFEEAPINRVLSPKGELAVAEVHLAGIPVSIGVWLVKVGRTNIYLIDTNLKENAPQHRDLAARLYIADRELRLQQEIVLGVGGVRVLRAFHINPVLWHANEGHTAFMMIERVREQVEAGKSFGEAVDSVRARTVFTTHTPVLADHDVFPLQLVEKYLDGFWQSLGIDKDAFTKLGSYAESRDFNMTALALRLSEQRCAVSKLHGEVTRRMWHTLWPNVPEEKVPISHVTNGVHVSSWVAREIGDLFTKYLGCDWVKDCDSPDLWRVMMDIPDEEFWKVRGELKLKLVAAIRERMRNWWAQEGMSLQHMMTMGALVEPDTLTIAFARRFTEYKRATIIFKDVERLKRIICDPRRPVQIIFAGKSHPADFPSKYILQRVYNLASSLDFSGRIAFVEDYDMHMARYLVHGVDVWLNTPRRLQEACGTSGMKASINGVLHLSVSDGWWVEGYNGSNGWAINHCSGLPPEEEDRNDAETIYDLLEKEIVPLYYARDRRGVPHGWVRLMKGAVNTITPAFSAHRMLREYVEHPYDAASKALRIEPEGTT